MVIKITGHSEDSLRAAAKQVLDYRDKVIDNNEVFLQVLCDWGIAKASGHLNNVADDYDPPDFEAQEPQVGGGSSSGKMSATLSLVGEQAAFVEFGAGIYYNGHPNGSPHDWGVDLGYTIGSWGLHQGLQEGWWCRKLHHYFKGTPTAAPLFHARQEIGQKIPEAASETFRS